MPKLARLSKPEVAERLGSFLESGLVADLRFSHDSAAFRGRCDSLVSLFLLPLPWRERREAYVL
jgi:hypothetical protein